MALQQPHDHMGPGQMFVVPRGMQHRPHAEEETHLLLIEPTGMPNSGDVRTAAPRQVVRQRLP